MNTIFTPFLWLGALALPPQDPAQAPAPVPDCAALTKEFETARSEWQTRYAAVAKTGDKDALQQVVKERPDAEAFVPRFEAGAAALAGKPGAVPFLAWLATNATGDTAKAAITTVMEKHMQDPGIARAVARLGGLHSQLGAAQTRAWLDAVLAQNVHAPVQQQARYTRAAMHVGTRAVAHGEGLRELAIADLKLVLADPPNPSLQGLATSLLYEAEHLEPGLTAPDIEGEDLDGAPFKLSDYRGKVVVLDFWGDW